MRRRWLEPQHDMGPGLGQLWSEREPGEKPDPEYAVRRRWLDLPQHDMGPGLGQLWSEREPEQKPEQQDGLEPGNQSGPISKFGSCDGHRGQ